MIQFKKNTFINHYVSWELIGRNWNPSNNKEQIAPLPLISLFFHIFTHCTHSRNLINILFQLLWDSWYIIDLTMGAI